MAQTKETTDYAAFTRRAIRGLGKRVAAGDLGHLADLAELHELVDAELARAVAGLRAEPNLYSWAEIGATLGITRQAALQRWRGAPGRAPGGQPGNLR